jgi:nitrate reductase NapE
MHRFWARALPGFPFTASGVPLPMKSSTTSEPAGSSAVHPADPQAPSTRQEETRSFLFLTIVTAPVLAVVTVAGWGFIVWMYQLLSGRLPGYTP